MEVRDGLASHDPQSFCRHARRHQRTLAPIESTEQGIFDYLQDMSP